MSDGERKLKGERDGAREREGDRRTAVLAAPGGRAGSAARRGRVRAAGAAPAAAVRETKGRAGSLSHGRVGQIVVKSGQKWSKID